MAKRHFPVFPNLEQLRHQAKDLLRAIRRGEAAALEDLATHHPERVEPDAAKLADAQLALARSYGVPSWPRLVIACRMTDAIWRDDIDTVRALVRKHPQLLHEDASGVKGNWGPPMSFAANLGRERIIAMLRGMGAEDVQFAFGRACLQGQVDTARQLIAMGARPVPGDRDGTVREAERRRARAAARARRGPGDEHGNRIAPVSMLLGTYCRNTDSKHRCLEMCAAHGVALPDTPPMAVHRGRIDLLEALLARDPRMLDRTFTEDEMYQPAIGHPRRSFVDAEHDAAGGRHAAASLRRLRRDRDRALADCEGRGCQREGGRRRGWLRRPHGVVRMRGRPVAEIAMMRSRACCSISGADPNARASLRKGLVDAGVDEVMHEFHDVTPLGWGEQFHAQKFVNRAAMQLIAERGGHL